MHLMPAMFALAAFAFAGVQTLEASPTGVAVSEVASATATLARTSGCACAQAVSATATPEPEKPAALPKLIKLGSKGCIPCGMMEPILKDLKQTRSHQFETVDYDVRQDRKKAEEYKVRAIPTQVFLDKDGKELFRCEGFISKENILKKWRELGYDFN